MPRASGPSELTAQFQAALAQLERVAQGSDFLAKQATLLIARVENAIVDIEDDYCAGYRLRGPGLSDICEVRLPGGWRILYKVNAQKRVPVLLLLGQITAISQR